MAEVDSTEVIQLLGAKVAQLEIDNAVLTAAVNGLERELAQVKAVDDDDAE